MEHTVKCFSNNSIKIMIHFKTRQIDIKSFFSYNLVLFLHFVIATFAQLKKKQSRGHNALSSWSNIYKVLDHVNFLQLSAGKIIVVQIFLVIRVSA